MEGCVPVAVIESRDRTAEETALPGFTRRQLLATAGAAPLAVAANETPGRPTLCRFTKHLPLTSYKELAGTLRSMGFPGADLTVRPRGHVLPENVGRDLPLPIRRPSPPTVSTSRYSRRG